MPTSTVNPNPFNRSQQEQVDVVVKDRDGVIDTTSPITWVSDNSALVDVVVDPVADPTGRHPLLVGKGPALGVTNVTGTCNAVYGGPTTVVIAVTSIADTPNQSVIVCTFGTAVPKT